MMLGRLLARPPTQDSLTALAPCEEDVCLVEAAKADPRDFAPLYARYVDSVYRYSFRRLGHPEAAADATSQVFAKALAALPNYRNDSRSFRSWLFAIAHNVLIDEDRAHRDTSTLEAAAGVATTGPSLEDQFLTSE